MNQKSILDNLRGDLGAFGGQDRKKRERERERERDANREEHHSLTGDRTELDQNGYKKKQRGQDRKAF